MTKKGNILLQDSVAYDILKYLLSHKKGYFTRIARDINRAMASVIINLQFLLKIECITQTKSGRRKYYLITDKGIFLVKRLRWISNKLK